MRDGQGLTQRFVEGRREVRLPGSEARRIDVGQVARGDDLPGRGDRHLPPEGGHQGGITQLTHGVPQGWWPQADYRPDHLPGIRKGARRVPVPVRAVASRSALKGLAAMLDKNVG